MTGSFLISLPRFAIAKFNVQAIYRIPNLQHVIQCGAIARSGARCTRGSEARSAGCERGRESSSVIYESVDFGERYPSSAELLSRQWTSFVELSRPGCSFVFWPFVFLIYTVNPPFVLMYSSPYPWLVGSPSGRRSRISVSLLCRMKPRPRSFNLSW